MHRAAGGCAYRGGDAKASGMSSVMGDRGRCGVGGEAVVDKHCCSPLSACRDRLVLGAR